MKRSPLKRMIFLLSLACAAVPFAFGSIRAIETGKDFRSLWMAVASFAGALAVMAIARVRAGPPASGLGLAALVLVVATLAAFVTGYLLGARAGPGALIVAGSMGLCWAAHVALHSLSTR